MKVIGKIVYQDKDGNRHEAFFDVPYDLDNLIDLKLEIVKE